MLSPTCIQLLWFRHPLGFFRRSVRLLFCFICQALYSSKKIAFFKF
nr:MAG TPA: hypothetical protein [Caudoviricetes sp.]